jgi:predicted dehydrogenase
MNNVGIIGAGLVSWSHAESIRNIDNACLKAVADILEEPGRALAKEFECDYYQDAEEMLKRADIQIVIIAIPTFLHEKYVTLCAQYGKHVLCEKPIEMTVEATKRMLDNVEKSGIIFMIGQVVRFWGGYTEIKKLYESGELGKVYMAYASRCSEIPKWGSKWMLDPEKGGGAIQELHVHDIDFLRYVFGEIDYVYCLANKDDTGCWNHAMSSIAFKSGEKAVAEAAYTMSSGYPFTMFFKAAGTKGTVEFYYKAGYNIGERDASSSELRIFRNNMEPVIMKIEQHDPYEDQFRYFLTCVEEGKQPERIPHHENLDVIQALVALRESADTGLIIHL